MLTLPKAIANTIHAHAEREYPNECCGVLLGSLSGGNWRLAAAIAVANANAKSPGNRYTIAPAEVARITLEARREGLEIAGFYHSHPDHPAAWSATDLSEAHWLGCLYLITEVRQGRAVITNAFLLAGDSEEEKHFVAIAVLTD